jgi:hypothetical protein
VGFAHVHIDEKEELGPEPADLPPARAGESRSGRHKVQLLEPPHYVGLHESDVGVGGVSRVG